MKFYEFGKEDNPVIMLLPGTCCHWHNNFKQVIPLLTESFKVVCVSYDGFDETENTEFPDMITETRKIERYIKEKFNGTIHAAYGCSLGGSFVGLLIQRKVIHINHGIIGSSDLDQASKFSAYMKTKAMGPMLTKMVKSGKVPAFIYNRLVKSCGEQYAEKALVMFGKDGVSMNFVSKKSAENQYYSDLVTSLYNKISVEGTTIHCFYAAKMGSEYLKRYNEHFKNPHIVEHNLFHEELLVCRPKQWVEDVKMCVLND